MGIFKLLLFCVVFTLSVSQAIASDAAVVVDTAQVVPDVPPPDTPTFYLDEFLPDSVMLQIIGWVASLLALFLGHTTVNSKWAGVLYWAYFIFHYVTVLFEKLNAVNKGFKPLGKPKPSIQKIE